MRKMYFYKMQSDNKGQQNLGANDGYFYYKKHNLKNKTLTHHDLQSKTFVITFYIQRSRCVWIRSVQTLPRFTMDGLSRLVVSYYTWGLFVRILIIDINIINDFLEGSLDYAILDAQKVCCVATIMSQKDKYLNYISRHVFDDV